MESGAQSVLKTSVCEICKNRLGGRGSDLHTCSRCGALTCSNCYVQEGVMCRECKEEVENNNKLLLLQFAVFGVRAN